jgi:hypothetical protein
MISAVAAIVISHWERLERLPLNVGESYVNKSPTSEVRVQHEN